MRVGTDNHTALYMYCRADRTINESTILLLERMERDGWNGHRWKHWLLMKLNQIFERHVMYRVMDHVTHKLKYWQYALKQLADIRLREPCIQLLDRDQIAKSESALNHQMMKVIDEITKCYEKLMKLFS